MLAICAFSLLFIPRLVAFFLFAKGATHFSQEIEGGALSQGNLLDGVSALAEKTLEGPMLAGFFVFLMAMVGILALAHMSWDYFEQQPSSFASAAKRGLRTLVRKGFGALIMLAVVFVFSSVLAVLRVIILCLLVMLPIELVAGHSGGIKSVWNSMFLKYSVKSSYGRWPIFSNMMTLGGTVLSIAFLGQLAIAYIGDMDVVMGTAAGVWQKTIPLFGGGTISVAFFVQSLLELIFDTVVIATAMPFVAALRYFSQKSTFTAAT